MYVKEREKRDAYTNYFKNNRNTPLISHAYAIENPRKWTGYGDDAWGQSAGVNNGGGRAQPVGPGLRMGGVVGEALERIAAIAPAGDGGEGDHHGGDQKQQHAQQIDQRRQEP